MIENPIAFSILCNAAQASWTLSSEIPGYNGINYGVFYDDVQLAKVAIRHAQIAKKLKVLTSQTLYINLQVNSQRFCVS